MKKTTHSSKESAREVIQIHLNLEDERLFKRALTYLGHPGSIMWRNFLAGTFNGLGFMLGTALVLTLVGYVLGLLHNSIPFLNSFDLWYQEQVERQIES